MATYQEHTAQAIRNLRVLVKNNQTVNDNLDWQVTMAFYAAVHFANAHLAKTINQHYRSHAKVDEALNPYVLTNPSAFNEDAYVAFGILRGLARRSRYLCSDNEANVSDAYHTIADKHFAKAIRNLDIVMHYFSNTHGYHFTQMEIKCDRIKQDKLIYFCDIVPQRVGA